MLLYYDYFSLYYPVLYGRFAEVRCIDSASDLKLATMTSKLSKVELLQPSCQQI